MEKRVLWYQHWDRKNCADVSTECFRHHQGESHPDDDWSSQSNCWYQRTLFSRSQLRSNHLETLGPMKQYGKGRGRGGRREVEGAPGLVVTHLQGSKGVGLLFRAFYLLCEDGPFCLLVHLDNAELIHLCEHVWMGQWHWWVAFNTKSIQYMYICYPIPTRTNTYI